MNDVYHVPSLFWSGCEGGSGLAELDISGNHLPLASTSLAPLPALASVSLGQLQVTSLGPASLALVPASVTSLQLSGMPRLRSLAPATLASLPRLRSLVISRNPQLAQLPRQLVTAAPLESLDLSSNQLAWLGAELVPWQLVTQLQLDHNPLHCHCRLDWLLQLPRSARVSAMVSCYSLK